MAAAQLGGTVPMLALLPGGTFTWALTAGASGTDTGRADPLPGDLEQSRAGKTPHRGRPRGPNSR